LREAEVRTYEAPVETIGMALSAITAQEALGYFEHCGYHAADRKLFDVRVVPTRRFPSTLPPSTEGQDNPRIVVVAIVLAHRADLPISIKTRPWYVRTDRLPKLPEEFKFLLITEHQLAS
jgi:hypothetical protein